MKALHTLALIAVGAVLNSSTPLCGSEAEGRTELALNKSPAYQPHLSYDVTKVGEKTTNQVNEPAGSRFQDQIADPLALRLRPGAEPQSETYNPKFELGVAKPNNVVQSKTHPDIEYSGILVQSFRSNPFQLLNPLAPAQYADGEANTVRNFITGRADGLKVLAIHY
jgi:hypothetical protein